MKHAMCTETRRLRKRRRAFASFSAVVLVGTTALALTALARVTTTQAKRASHAAADAQLRQLLFVGQAFVDTQTIKANESNRIDIPLPEAFGTTSAVTVSYQREGAGAPLIAMIEASHNQRQVVAELVQTESGQWQARDVQMP